MKIKALLFVLLCVTAQAPLASASAPQSHAKAGNITAKDLLIEAEALSRPLPLEERADALLDLAQASATVDPNRAMAWSDEIWRIAQAQLPAGPYRAAMQKNALTTIATLNPDRALALWRLQDPPEAWTKGKIVGEDIRADGTRVLFPSLWRRHGPAAYHSIVSLSRWLGETGQYPYQSMEWVLEQSSADTTHVQEIFSDATRYLPTSQKFASTNHLFVDFILSSEKSVPQELLRQAIEAEIHELNGPTSANSAPRYISDVSTPKGEVAFNSQTETLIYRLLPSIRRIDPNWARQLVEKHPSLKNAPDLNSSRGVRAGGVVVYGDEPPSQDAIDEAMDASHLYRAQQLAAQNPEEAARLVLAIKNPQLQTLGLANIAPAYRRVSPSESDSWLTGAAKRFGSMPDDADKLRLSVALCDSYLAEKRFSDASDVAEQAFDLGEQLFDAFIHDNPASMAYTADSFQPLTDLVTATVRELPDPTASVTRVRKIRSQLLRTRMLTTAAKALSMRKHGSAHD